jgi:hypothetical protein
LALWLMLAVSGSVTALLLVEFYQQSTNTLVSRAEDAVVRACRDLGDSYAFFVTGWHGARQGEIDDVLKRELVGVVEAALSRASGVEGGLWQAGNGFQPIRARDRGCGASDDRSGECRRPSQ